MIRKTLFPILALVGLVAVCVGDETKMPSLLLDPVDASRDRTVPVKVYLPRGDGAHPVVIFSHGLGGSRENSAYLGEHWAQNGYAAVFVQHPGSDESVWKSAETGERMAELKKAASLESALDRFADIPFVIDRLEEWNVSDGHALHRRLDLGHIGLCGHSFGAVTTQALMGQRFPGSREFHDSRIDAFFLMSPSIPARFPPDRAFGGIKAPVLCMTGTEDGSPIQPDLIPESRREVYRSLPPGDKYQLVFDGGTHSAFSDTPFRDEGRLAHHHPAIQRISTRFWDAYLKDDAGAKAWLKSERVGTDAKLADGDTWEWK
ncbi:MAG TPA: acetylhydrolase [Bacteroidia bacterium]|nr:acetylhydrolase [Bacteroidia bacterium]